MKLSHEVLLALTYVSQVSDSGKVKDRFIESMSGLAEAFSFSFAEELDEGFPEERVMPICTLHSSFGFAVLAEGARISDAERAVFRNGFKFLAVLLENRVQASVLESINKKLLVRSQQDGEALRKSEEHFKHVFESANVAKSITSLSGRIHVNKAFCELVGYTQEELRDKTWQSITPLEDVEPTSRLLNMLVQGEKESTRFTKRYFHKNGSVIWADVSVALYRDAQGKPEHFITTVVDITEHRRAEEERDRLQAQLLQAQKMESIGRLAGGVAHDYNNMLSVILGYTEFMMEKVNPGEPLHADLLEILSATKRSIDITSQLLAFARKQIASPRVLDLNETVEGTLKMLRKFIGEDLGISWLPGSELWCVNMDPSQVNQILVNLCVNSRDAINGVGQITIETRNIRLDSDYCSDHVGSSPGEFVLLTVSDDGCGMDKETLEHVFEPFFTTKGVGQGTGLGLATVYGIVKQNNGFLNVYSEPGRGTTFRLYLPRHDRGEEAPSEASEPVSFPKGRGETVLIVEDEDSILKLVMRVLRSIGYTVLVASTPASALEQVRLHNGRIHLLLTDVVMPEMNGSELSRLMLSIHPDLRVLYMSGYTANVIAHRGVLDKGINFLQKPFSKNDLAAKVRAVLDRAD